MTALPTYALLAVVATWPVFALDTSQLVVPADPPSAQTPSSTGVAVAEDLADAQVPRPPAPPAPASPAVAPEPADAPPPPPPPPPPPSFKASPPAVSSGQAAPKVQMTTPAPTVVRVPGQNVTVAIEVSLVDAGDSSAKPRSVLLRVADGESGQFRQEDSPGTRLNVDVGPRIVDASRLKLSVAVELAVTAAGEKSGQWNILRTRTDIVLKDGVQTKLSQWFDPTLKRSMDLFVKATQER